VALLNEGYRSTAIRLTGRSGGRSRRACGLPGSAIARNCSLLALSSTNHLRPPCATWLLVMFPSFTHVVKQTVAAVNSRGQEATSPCAAPRPVIR